ncbi:MAG TPA: hypothetical protein PKL08_02420 [Thermoanaerobaculaceae bacterium]|nr:hypothetical protein [Thermoanaerobaculaceae bacterium]
MLLAVLCLLWGTGGTALGSNDPWESVGDERPALGARAGARLVQDAREAGTRPAMPLEVPRLDSGVRPRIAGALSLRERHALARSYSLAVERVVSQPACRSLFARLGTDGAAMLARTYYLRAGVEGKEACAGGTVAFTHVRDHRCWICPGFSNLSDSAAAMILVHEALHLAGMREEPDGKGALSSFGISRLVARSCASS